MMGQQDNIVMQYALALARFDFFNLLPVPA